MDLRKQKTERALRDAFFELRRTKPIERITIRELCERAEVGKATFYLHFRDIYDLSSQMQRELVEQILDDLSHPEEIVTNTREFTRQFASSLLARRERIEVLFSGAQRSVLADAIEEGVRAYVFELLPEARDDVRLNVLLTYQIQGGYYAYSRYVGGSCEGQAFEALLEASALMGTAWR